MKPLFPLFLSLVLITLGVTTPAASQTTVFEETFDAVTEPDLPSSILAADDSWGTSTSSESPGSGGNNLRHGGTTTGDIEFGPIDLVNATSATISYLARRTSSYPADSLALAVSVDGGSTWITLMGPGAALPDATSEYETVSTSIPDSIAADAVIRLRFRGYGGSSSGSNIRIDDLTVSAEVDLSSVTDTFGFGTASSTTAGMPVSVPLDLAWTGADSIQGIQFDVDFDASLLALTDVIPRSPVSSPGWTIDYFVTAGSARILLLGDVADVLSPGVHAGLLALEFQPNGGATSDSLTAISLTDLIVSANDPGGTGLPIALLPDDHAITIDIGQANISLSTDSLSLGTASVGSTSTGTLTVSNPSGDGDLVVSGVSSSSTLFSASPGSFSVPPGGSVDLEVAFSPTETEFGFQSGIVTLSHNAPMALSTFKVSATGTSGRGDVTSDGIVDVGDVVAGIDAVLERTDPAPAVPTIDIHPFPVGDGRIDVRDLTVLVHAILSSEWPDAVALPISAPDITPSGKLGSAAMVLLDAPGAGSLLRLSPELPLRGVQLELSGLETEPIAFVHTAAPEADAAASGPVVSRSAYDAANGRFVYLAASAHEALRSTDRLEIRNLQADFGLDNIVTAVGISDTFERVSITVADNRDAPGEQPHATLLEISVYPNPMRSGQDATVRMVQAPSQEDSNEQTDTTPRMIRVVDLLGRTIVTRDIRPADGDVTLDTSRLAPGLYFVRVGSGDSGTTVPLTIVR